jgi:uncharacterized delta-60 repeat protein
VSTQSDGRIVVSGSSHNGTNDDFALARYNPDGALDPAFGSGGKLTTAVGGGADVAYDLAIRSDGRIVAAGYSHNGSNFDFAVARYTSSGSPDTSFDGDGSATTDFFGGDDLGYAAAIQTDGQIIVAGKAFSSASGFDFALARYAGGEIRQEQSITFDPLPDRTFGDADFTVTATASSGLPVAFSASGYCTISGSTVHLTNAGTCTITATQGGNASFFAAIPVSRSFSVAPARTFTVADGDVAGLIAAINSANAVPGPDAIELAAGGTYTLTAVDNSGYGYFGPTGTPIIQSDVILNGNGATIRRSSAPGTPAFRVLFNFSRNSSQLRINDLTVKGGSSYGGGLLNSGDPRGIVVIHNSTITENDDGGGGGGGITNYCGSATLQNSTVSNNTATSGFGGGGIFNIGDVCGSTVTLINSTVFDNRAALGRGDAIASALTPAGSIILKNSILASPSRGLGNECYGVSAQSLGHNLTADNSCGLAGNGDLVAADPMVEPLGNNGGPTPTNALIDGSPAINAVPPADCTDPTGNPIGRDQRGTARPQGPACDIGAYEGFKLTQSIFFAQLPDRTFGEADLAVSATASSGLPITLTASGNCVISGNVVRLNGPGTCSITASQPGNADFLPAPEVSRTFAIAEATLEFAAAEIATTESDGAVSVTVARTSGFGTAVAVDYAVFNGSATGGTDFVPVSGTLNFSVGETSKTFTLPILDDSILEPDETLGLELSNPTNEAVIGGVDSAVLTIGNDDKGASRISVESVAASIPALVPLTANVRASDSGSLICEGSVAFKVSTGGTLVRTVGPAFCDTSSGDFSATVDLSVSGNGTYDVVAVFSGSEDYFSSSGRGSVAVGSNAVLVPSIGSIAPASLVAGLPGSATIVVSGSGFSTNSSVVWRDPITLIKTHLAISGRADGELTATVPADLLTRPDAYQISIDNTPTNTTDGESVSHTLFVTSEPVIVTGVTVAVPDPETNEASAQTSGTSGTVSLEATAPAGTAAAGSLTVAQYNGDPIGPSAIGGSSATTFSSSGSYFDVHVSSGSTFSAVSIDFCETGGTTLYWFDGNAWQHVAPQSFNSETGCISVRLNDDPVNSSSPTISELTGTVIAAAGGPELRTISISPAAPQPAGSSVSLTAGFVDPANVGSDLTYLATIFWGDGSSSAGTVSGSSVFGTHTYAAPGVYRVRVKVVRNGNGAFGSAEYEHFVVIYDAAGGFVTGGGWIQSPLGAFSGNPDLAGKASFGFSAKYLRGSNTPSGETQFTFHTGGITFRSQSYEWLVVSGARAQYKGVGKINGMGNYRFILTAIDGQVAGGGGIDRFRIKIWDAESGVVVYDNQRGADDGAAPSTALGGGSIVIHK